jgi:hypothetical protein
LEYWPALPALARQKLDNAPGEKPCLGQGRDVLNLICRAYNPVWAREQWSTGVMRIEKKQTGLLDPLDQIMYKRKQKSMFIFIALFLILGIGMLYFGIDILLDAEDSIRRGFILIHHNNIFIKYGFSFMCFFAGLGCIFLPILAVKWSDPQGLHRSEHCN